MMRLEKCGLALTGAPSFVINESDIHSMICLFRWLLQQLIYTFLIQQCRFYCLIQSRLFFYSCWFTLYPTILSFLNWCLILLAKPQFCTDQTSYPTSESFAGFSVAFHCTIIGGITLKASMISALTKSRMAMSSRLSRLREVWYSNFRAPWLVIAYECVHCANVVRWRILVGGFRCPCVLRISSTYGHHFAKSESTQL